MSLSYSENILKNKTDRIPIRAECEEFVSLCDKLKARLQVAQTTQIHAIVEQAID